ncbi:hypothetical protein [Anaerotalea alkaliphila]|uniref:Uncharacterized protein n=1 Tax=Anaerotalea alkaliphila TaxID=2662126 RepID=A0A7X5KMD9_9FIRM|nr:hypothetical protein [Anaerotalea alkaliphila]NDL67699.1 hypothetical protein [Anaerotalea alkaliphila]
MELLKELLADERVLKVAAYIIQLNIDILIIIGLVILSIFPMTMIAAYMYERSLEHGNIPEDEESTDLQSGVSKQ